MLVIAPYYTALEKFIHSFPSCSTLEELVHIENKNIFTITYSNTQEHKQIYRKLTQLQALLLVVEVVVVVYVVNSPRRLENYLCECGFEEIVYLSWLWVCVSTTTALN